MQEFFYEAIELISTFIRVILNLDTHLILLTQNFGGWTYLILFLIIFAETGLVIFPFLPGDSLLFAAGAVCALEGSGLQIEVLAPLLVIAGIIGDSLNYSIGLKIGPKIFSRESSLFFNKDHLIKTQSFYEKHGAQTIVIARFIPIIRTFAPFVAGIGKMSYSRFITYNIAGSIFWVGSMTLAGYIFGNLPVVQKNFHIVIFAIIAISFMPVVHGWWKSRRESLRA